MSEETKARIQRAAEHFGPVRSRLDGVRTKGGGEGDWVIFDDGTALFYPENGLPTVVRLGSKFYPKPSPEAASLSEDSTPLII